ncbi:MAG TPA: DUF3305 domain-containing protein [Burkholderiaceae bacterium]|nr:DUF3305 domain-containing protein [Burkholderiaceae bacterium]
MNQPNRPALEVAVVIEREASPNRWEDWRFRIVEVLPDEPAFGRTPRRLHDDGRFAHWLHPGFRVELFTDDAKGYYLNLSTGTPVWFVMWRIDQDDPSIASPQGVSLSYNDAARWMDNAEERVDSLPLPPDVREWLQAYVDVNYRPVVEPRRKPQSFLNPEERARGARK